MQRDLAGPLPDPKQTFADVEPALGAEHLCVQRLPHFHQALFGCGIGAGCASGAGA